MHHGPFEYDHPSLVPDARTETVNMPFRKLTCACYHDCLDVAVKSKWRSWCCDSCEVEEKINPTQQYAEMISLLELFSEVIRPTHINKDTQIPHHMIKEYE